MIRLSLLVILVLMFYSTHSFSSRRAFRTHQQYISDNSEHLPYREDKKDQITTYMFNAPKMGKSLRRYKRNTDGTPKKQEQEPIYIVQTKSQLPPKSRTRLFVTSIKDGKTAVTHTSHTVTKHREIRVKQQRLPPLKTVYLLNKDSTYDMADNKTTLKYHLNNKQAPFKKIGAIRLNLRLSNNTRLLSVYMANGNQTFKSYLTKNLHVVNLALIAKSSKWKTLDVTDDIMATMALHENCKSFYIHVEISSYNIQLSKQLKTSYLAVDIQRKMSRKRRSHVKRDCRVRKTFVPFVDLGMEVIFPYTLRYRKGIHISYCSGPCKASRDHDIFSAHRTKSSNSQKCCVATRMNRGILIYYKDLLDNSVKKQKLLDVNAIKCECR